MKYLKNFESIRDEYPGMFAPRDPADEPQPIPGIWVGGVDPNDDDEYQIDDEEYHEEFPTSDRKRYKYFLKLTKKRNFKEVGNEIKINLLKLGHEFCLHVYSPGSNLKEFLENELIGKYISEGFSDIIHDIEYEGIIEKVYLTYDNCSAFINLKLKDKNFSDNNFCGNIITIDKFKSTANQYNL